jgi:hypothetical protein
LLAARRWGLSAPPASRAEPAATDVIGPASGVGNTLDGGARAGTTDGGLRDKAYEGLYIDRR